jgi:phospholipid/cholesterol/gamma-HCH transport system permease protein
LRKPNGAARARLRTTKSTGITPESVIREIDDVMSSVYEADYLTPALRARREIRSAHRAELRCGDLPVSELEMSPQAVTSGFRARGLTRDRVKTAAQPCSWPDRALDGSISGGLARRHTGVKRGLLEGRSTYGLQVLTIRGECFRGPSLSSTSSSSSIRIGLGSLTGRAADRFSPVPGWHCRPHYARSFGARPVVGRLISASMVKELGPVLTGLMLAGRVGSGIAAELGSMVVTDQINALRALGTDPIRKLVVPRVLAGFIMAPVLTVISDGVGIVGGWLVAVFQLRVVSSVYWSSILKGLYLEDAWMGLIKPFCLGFVIVSIGCHVGLRTTGGTQGVGRSTTNAVVAASVAVIAVDFFVTRVLISFFY